jgi:glycosyltransferase involved in cell wall biosynthesis
VVSLKNYAHGQALRGHAVRVYTLDGYHNTSPACQLAPAVRRTAAQVSSPQKLGASGALRKAIFNDEPAHVYHLHGIWLRAMFYGAEKAKQAKRPYLIEVNGALDPLELATKPYRKRLVRWWFQDRMFHEASCLHVNSGREAVHLRELGFKAPIVNIPAGFNIEEGAELLQIAENNPPVWAKEFQGRRILLYLARIHEAKGIDDLIAAWAVVANKFTDWDLVIVGPGSAEDVLSRQRECELLHIDRRCRWLGMVSDVERAWLYDQAEIYTLPSHKENFGNTVQESLGYSTPVITTTQTPWEKLAEWRCGWICEDNVESLTETLHRALSTEKSTLEAMGERGRSMIHLKFSLRRVIDDQLAVYSWLQGGVRPECLSAD